MSERPVFIPSKENNKYVETINISFTWFSGFSVSQKRKSIKSKENNTKLAKPTE